MKASPLCQHSVAGSKACSGAWDKNICKAHHFLTSPLQHFLPKAVRADSSAVAATSDLQPHPANMLGAHVLMQTLQGGGGTYSDSLKPMGIAHLFKVCEIRPPARSHYSSHWSTKELNLSMKLHYSTAVEKNQRPVVTITQVLGHAGGHYMVLFWFLKSSWAFKSFNKTKSLTFSIVQALD